MLTRQLSEELYPATDILFYAVCCILIFAPNKVGGTRAGKGNRTLITRWEISYTNRCAIPAYYFSSLYKTIPEITTNEKIVDTIISTNKNFTKDILIIP